MPLINIIVSIIILVFLAVFIIFVMFFLLKYKKIAITTLSKDLNFVINNYYLNKVDYNDLPFNLEVETKQENIYLHSRVILCEHENFKKFANKKNHDITKEAGSKIKFLYYLPLINNLSRTKLKLLNQTDLLVINNEIILLDPINPVTIKISELKEIIFFWEKKFINKKNKDYAPLLNFFYNKKPYFILFNHYNDLLKFIACINKLF